MKKESRLGGIVGIFGNNKRGFRESKNGLILIKIFFLVYGGVWYFLSFILFNLMTEVLCFQLV